RGVLYCVIIPVVCIRFFFNPIGMQKRKTLENRDTLLQAVAARIRALREGKGIAQEVFAYEAGIDRSYYGGIERGKYSPTAINLAKIAVALGAEVGELFPGKEELASLLAGDSASDA
uniref:helix-turn-helix domain-containing protein n=1 Tax=Armatimonas sp. TaxID=1872638 RepID=UPI003750377F